MGNSFLGEVLLLVFFFIKSYYSLDIKLLENIDVLSWMVSISLISISFFDWSHKGHELSRNDPIEIAVFDSLVCLILLDIESLEIVPVELHCVLKALENLKEGALIETVSFGRIPIWLEQVMVGLEQFIGMFSGNFENDYTERGHQEGAVHHFVRFLRGAVVEDPVVLIILIPEESSQLSRVSVNHCKVQWTEVLIKWKILEIIINVEKEGIFVVLRWLRIRYPKEFI